MAIEKKSVSAMYADYKSGKIDSDEFLTFLIDGNESGEIDDATYDRYHDKVSVDTFADNDIPTLD